MEYKNTILNNLKVRTGISSGYWTCTGVKGQADARGFYWDNPQAAVCYKRNMLRFLVLRPRRVAAKTNLRIWTIRS